MPTILVTGAAGYIGSHTVVQLLQAGFSVVAVDNHVNSSPRVYERIRSIAGKNAPQLVATLQTDLGQTQRLLEQLRPYRLDACIHFAALKAVGESADKPLHYMHNNVGGLLSVLACLDELAVRTFVFSSSATVYGHVTDNPIAETAPLSALSVYGQTKCMSEEILRSLGVHNTAPSPKDWRIGVLRYFNPVGAHPSGMIGEMPKGTPNNLMPYMTQVAAGIRPVLQVFGDDYPTPDGTCIRDYIHVQDLAQGHVAALHHLFDLGTPFTVNLGTGLGTSVRELIHTFEAATGVPIPHEVCARRAGDMPACYADPRLAEQLLGWRTQLSLTDMCRDAWRWQTLNPHGYS